MAKKIDIYLRQSKLPAGDKAKGTSLSIDVQEQRIRGFLVAQGLEVGRVFKDVDVSGRGNVRRPGFSAVMERGLTGKSDGVAFYDLSRFGRNTIQTLDAITRLTDAGALVLSTAEALDASTAAGKMVLTFLAAQAQYASDQISERWGANLERLLQDGKRNGKAPYGYSRDDNGRFVPNEDADVVRDLFLRRAQGDPWAALGRLYGKPVSSLQRIVANRVYLGELAWNGETNPHAHPPLVSMATFEAANGLTVSELKSEDPLAERPWASGGIIRCGRCGRAMVRTAVKSGGKTYTYFRCSSYRQGCATATYDEANTAVLDFLRPLVTTHDGEGGVLEVAARLLDADPAQIDTADTRMMNAVKSLFLEAIGDGVAIMAPGHGKPATRLRLLKSPPKAWKTAA